MWILSGIAFAHPILDAVPDPILEDAKLQERLCEYSDRLLIGTVTSAVPTATMLAQQQGGWPAIYTDVTFTVERRIVTRGPAAATLTLRIPGGTVNGLTVVASGLPQMGVGERWAVALKYGGGNWTAVWPQIVQAIELSTSASLPTNTTINQAFAEYCGE